MAPSQRTPPGPGGDGKRNPRSPTGPLVNIGLLERELGSVEYRLLKMAAGDPERPRLEEQKAQLVKAIDREQDRKTGTRS